MRRVNEITIKEITHVMGSKSELGSPLIKCGLTGHSQFVVFELRECEQAVDTRIDVVERKIRGVFTRELFLKTAAILTSRAKSVLPQPGGPVMDEMSIV